MSTFLPGGSTARRRRAAMHAASFTSREARKARMNTAEASISGTPTSGETLTASLTGNGVLPTYQWMRGGTVRTGQTAATYVLDAGDVGELVTCMIGFRNVAGYQEYLFAPAVTVS